MDTSAPMIEGLKTSQKTRSTIKDAPFSILNPLGEIGKHDRLKICSYWVAGSSPAVGNHLQKNFTYLVEKIKWSSQRKRIHAGKREKKRDLSFFNAFYRIRTCDIQLRRLLLYPTELKMHVARI